MEVYDDSTGVDAEEAKCSELEDTREFTTEEAAALKIYSEWLEHRQKSQE